MVKIVADDDVIISSPSISKYTSYSHTLNSPLKTPLNINNKIIPKSSKFTANIDITPKSPVNVNIEIIDTPIIKNKLNFSPDVNDVNNNNNNNDKEYENENENGMNNNDDDINEKLNMDDSIEDNNYYDDDNINNNIDLDIEIKPFYNIHNKKNYDNNDDEKYLDDEDYDINQNQLNDDYEIDLSNNNQMNNDLDDYNNLPSEIQSSFNAGPIRKILPEIPSIGVVDTSINNSGKLLDTHGNVIKLNFIGENVQNRLDFLNKKYPLSRSFRVGWGPNGKLVMPLRYSEKGEKVPQFFNNDIVRKIIPNGPRLFSENRFGSVIVMNQIQGSGISSDFNIYSFLVNSAESVALLEAHSSYISV